MNGPERSGKTTVATAQPVNSPNFGFLSKHDQVLVGYAARAERYVLSDPNAALVKLRQFAELLSKHAAAASGIALDTGDTFAFTLDRLWSMRVINQKVRQLFNGIRHAGNDAAHHHLDERRVALYQLRMARELAVWFHRSFKDPQFKSGPFVAPPDPANAEEALKAELDQIRDEFAKVTEESQGAQATAEEHARHRQEAEEKARKLYEDLDQAMELASESEKLLEAKSKEYEQKIAELQARVAELSEAERTAIVETAHAQSEQVSLDEADTRRLIDAQLRDAGWDADSEAITYANGSRPVKGKNVAIAEWPTKKGRADYCLFVGLKPVALAEAKRKNLSVAGSIEQSKRYSRDFQLDGDHQSPGGPWGEYKVPFLFATNGEPFFRPLMEKSGIWFLDARRETNHSRALEAWYTPEGLTQLLDQDIQAADDRLETEPTDYLPLRDYQAAAVRAVENAIIDGQREILVAMATGTGKTITCIGLIYRLIKTGRFRRILFLVDRTALGEQTFDKLTDVRLENLQTFCDIYDVKEMGDIKPETDTRLQIATVQGIVKRLLYSDDADPVPVDWYDCIVIDECHRGYNLDQEMTEGEYTFRSEMDYISKYRRVIDHFDAVRIGLTATPALHTTEIFGPPVYQYTYHQAVVDGWLIDHEPPFRIVTKLAEKGISWKQGDQIPYYDSREIQMKLFETPDDVDFEISEFNRTVVTENFNRTVCKTLAEHIDPSLPGKTLIFCANDLHADMVVRLLKEAFDDQYDEVRDDTVVKITGRADKPLQLIRRYKNEQQPKVVVTVDLLTTGVDVPAITNLVFIRRVRSRILFEQMLGRATRLCDDLFGPGEDKERFYVFDAVDLYSNLERVSQMRPVVAKVNISFGQLIEELSTIDDDDFASNVKDQLLAKLQRKKLSENQVERLETATNLDRRGLIDFVKKAKPKKLAQWFDENKSVVNILDEIRKSGTRFLISDHSDEIITVDRGYGKASKPQDYLEAFKEYVTKNLNDLPALIVVTQRPRDLTRAQLRELRLKFDEEGFTEASLRTAWRETTNQDIAASIIGYIRHVALGQPLMAHADRVRAAMAKVMASRSWTAPQRKWLERIGKQLEQEVIVDRDALNSGQFKRSGGFSRLNKQFNGELDAILEEIAEAVWQSAA